MKPRKSVKNDLFFFNKEVFAEFKKETGSSLSYPASKEIVETLFDECFKFVNSTGRPIELGPLGYFGIRKKKSSNKIKVFYNTLTEEGRTKPRRLINRHTNGIIYNYFIRFSNGLRYRSTLVFKATRDQARNLGQEINSGKIPPI